MRCATTLTTRQRLRTRRLPSNQSHAKGCRKLISQGKLLSPCDAGERLTPVRYINDQRLPSWAAGLTDGGDDEQGKDIKKTTTAEGSQPAIAPLIIELRDLRQTQTDRQVVVYPGVDSIVRR